MDERGVVANTSNYLPGTLFNISLSHPTEVILTASDAAGNNNSCIFSVDVIDVTAPVLLCPSNITLILSSSSAANGTFWVNESLLVAQIFDNSGNFTITDLLRPAGNKFGVGSTLVSNSAIDPSGNSASCAFTVTVVDTTPPNITLCNNQTIVLGEGNIGERARITVTVPNAQDNSGGELNVTLLGPAESHPSPLFLNGSVSVLLVSNVTLFPVAMTVEDPSGLTSFCNYTVAVVLPSVSASAGAAAVGSGSSSAIIVGGAVAAAVISILLVAMFVMHRRAQRLKNMPHDFAGLLKHLQGAEKGEEK